MLSTAMNDITRDQLLMRLAALEPALRAGGVARLSLIGSRARGDHRANSDIDLLIDVESGRKFSLLDLVAVGHIVEDKFHLASSVVERCAARPRFLEEVHADEIRVF
jgi:uncharacterized protein